jgi:hypothetical protein
MFSKKLFLSLPIGSILVSSTHSVPVKSSAVLWPGTSYPNDMPE